MKITAILIGAVILLSGCTEHPAPPDYQNAEISETDTAADIESAPAVTQTETEPAEPELFAFNPHIYSPMLAQEIPQEHWDAFYHLCDALRAGETTFECDSQEAYEWAMDPCVLGHLFPAACMKISGESNDGTTPFENGVGKIYYNMPIDEFTARQTEFEEKVVNVLNGWLESDDNDFEKCLKLYDYMVSNYVYEDFPTDCGDGAYYYTLMNQKGVCDELSGVYNYLLLQVGVDSVEVGCFDPAMCHAWTYVLLDGQGYHIDPTWSLKSMLGTDQLSLEYFMMTDEQRIKDGCPVDDLTVELLPEFWVNMSSMSFPATDSRYSAYDCPVLDELDEANKIVRYIDMYGNSFEMHYS